VPKQENQKTLDIRIVSSYEISDKGPH